MVNWCIFTPIDVIIRREANSKLSLNNKNTWFLNKKFKEIQLSVWPELSNGVEAWMPTATQLQGWITCSRVNLKIYSPSLAAVASATKPWIRFLFPKKAKRLRVIDDDNLKHLFKYLFGLPPARQQAKRLQLITHTLGFWASKYIWVSFHSTQPTFI